MFTILVQVLQQITYTYISIYKIPYFINIYPIYATSISDEHWWKTPLNVITGSLNNNNHFWMRSCHLYLYIYIATHQYHWSQPQPHSLIWSWPLSDFTIFLKEDCTINTGQLTSHPTQNQISNMGTFSIYGCARSQPMKNDVTYVML